MKPANDALMNFILNLTDEQADKLIEHFDLLKRLPDMTSKELIFTETFLDKVFGKETA